MHKITCSYLVAVCNKIGAVHVRWTSGLKHPTHLVFRAGVFGLRPQFGLPASPRGSWCCGAGGVFGLRPQTPINLGVSKSLANVKNIRHCKVMYCYRNFGNFKHVFGICTASFVNHARRETSVINIFSKLFWLLEATMHSKKLFESQKEYGVRTL